MFTDYALDERIIAALTEKGITTPTPVQREALPPALEGRDVIAQARTGTEDLALDCRSPSSWKPMRPRRPPCPGADANRNWPSRWRAR